MKINQSIWQMSRSPLTPLADGSPTRILVVEASDEGDVVTVEVGLVVEGILGVEECLVGGEDTGDVSSVIFKNEAGLKARARQHVEEFRGAGMVMRRGQAARSVYVKDSLDRWAGLGGQIGETYASLPTLTAMPLPKR